MDLGIVLITFLVGAGICGFAVLARELMRNWRAGSKGKEVSDADLSRRNRAFQQCYNDCMATARWDPDERDACTLHCS